jgi:hypothetical protein
MAHLSLGMHYLLLFGYFFDLLYGLAYPLQWQYQAVSLIGLILLGVQHIQLMRLFLLKQRVIYLLMHGIVLFGVGVGLGYFWIETHCVFTRTTTLVLGSIAQGSFLVVGLPQIIKNNRLKSGVALSAFYLYLSLCLVLLDLTSAFCLGWGLPNKIATILSLMMKSILLGQYWYYARIRVHVGAK